MIFEGYNVVILHNPEFFQHHKEEILDNNDGKHTYIKIAMEQKLIGEELRVLNQIYGNYYLR